ncbi:3-phosphoshikimate 1-carboxyvinyltransferase [Actinomyces sp. 2119]|uniref:3-phosphoshikimate 1-carboxyvinyltransferase n=1 Tax=Actinomyces sp. 2119 TaxID=2321393 RepID=UPI000E6B7EA0|nr:3-phosphoshikimate 1-carboxyvinyltransferase [Actinomyces sp. 2119]RJF43256.1 3-phosphoshikimate 1-carboxyvinyltransferase [Actinomyces sp. 2119]
METLPEASSWWPAPTASGLLDATVSLPGSKSLTARALVLAAAAREPTTLTGVLRSRDTDLMTGALRTLGAGITEVADATATDAEALPATADTGAGTRLRVTPSSLPLHVAPGGSVDCGLAGTVMRFVPALAVLADAPVVLDGDPAARLRPMAPLLEVLSTLGATVTYLGRPGFLPVRIKPDADRLLRPGTGRPSPALGQPHRVKVDASSSSQLLSALLLVAPLLPGGLEVTTTGSVPSMAHVRMTVESLRQRGVTVEEPDTPGPGATWRVLPGRPVGGRLSIEPDLSNAGPFLAAALVAGGTVRVLGWPSSTTQAGDAWRTLLPRMGGSVALAASPVGGQVLPVLSVHGSGQVHGIDADLYDVGELAPTVAALAAVAAHQGRGSRLTGIAHLRGHETDRLAALATEIRRLGGDAQETDDGLVIRPARLHAARLHSYADHRMATFAAVVGLAVPGVEVDDVECTSKTLPGFAGMWQAMLDSTGHRGCEGHRRDQGEPRGEGHRDTGGAGARTARDAQD